jgi:hypothetical protein
MSAYARRTRLVEKPTTQDPNSSTTREPNAPIEASTWLAIKSKVKLLEKVAELRRKLYQKAKQEPKFRCGYPRVAFRAIHNYIVERLTNHLQRRSQGAYRPPEGKTFYAHVHDLGLKRL